MQVPSNVMYTIEELGAENYKTYINNDTLNRKSMFMTTINSPENNTLSFENNYESNVLTGLFVNNMPYIILMVVSLIVKEFDFIPFLDSEVISNLPLP